MLILLSDLLDPIFTVETHADGLVSFNELIEFLRQVLILKLKHSDMVVESVDFSLEVGVLVEERRVVIAMVLEILPQLHDCVLSHPNLGVIVLDESRQFCISDALLVNPSLDVCIF